MINAYHTVLLLIMGSHQVLKGKGVSPLWRWSERGKKMSLWASFLIYFY